MSGHRFHRSNIGSISTGTLRNQDLIESFIYELQQQRPLHRSDRATIKRIEASIKANGGELDGYCEQLPEHASEDVNALIDALNEYAPHGFYFGSHPGDGADFGFWLEESFIEEFDGLKVSDTSEVPARYSGHVLLVNDHGNVSLYMYSRGKAREIWAVV
jgi:hypothetical protein